MKQDTDIYPYWAYKDQFEVFQGKIPDNSFATSFGHLLHMLRGGYIENNIDALEQRK